MPPAVQLFLPATAFFRGVISGTECVCPLPPEVCSTTEWTTQVLSAGVAAIGQEPNSAVHAVHRTVAQLRMQLQDGVQFRLIVTNKRMSAIILVPVGPKSEKLPDRDDKKARFSVRMRTVLFTPSSYFIDARASRGRTRIFCAPFRRHAAPSNPPAASRQPVPLHSSRQSAQTASLHALLGRKNSLLFFPSSGSI